MPLLGTFVRASDHFVNKTSFLFCLTGWHQRLFTFPFSFLLCSQLSLSRCSELHADWQPGAEEACVSLPDELCQESARHGHHGCQQLREGNLRDPASVSSTSSNVFRSVSIQFVSAWQIHNLCSKRGPVERALAVTRSARVPGTLCASTCHQRSPRGEPSVSWPLCISQVGEGGQGKPHCFVSWQRLTGTSTAHVGWACYCRASNLFYFCRNYAYGSEVVETAPGGTTSILYYLIDLIFDGCFYYGKFETYSSRRSIQNVHLAVSIATSSWSVCLIYTPCTYFPDPHPFS